MGGETVKARLHAARAPLRDVIVAHADEHAVRLLCRVPGVARRRYRAWQRAAPHSAGRAARRAELVEEIRARFAAGKRRYGAPRIHAELRGRGHRLSKRAVAKVMTSRRDGREASNGIRPPRGKRKVPIATDSRHSHAIAPNLLDRNLEVAAPDTVWLADISGIPTGEGWLSPAAVKDPVTDPATMEIVGRSMSERLKGTLCESALKMAIRNRRPPPRSRGG